MKSTPEVVQAYGHSIHITLLENPTKKVTLTSTTTVTTTTKVTKRKKVNKIRTEDASAFSERTLMKLSVV